jgi:hypothetical protein
VHRIENPLRGIPYQQLMREVDAFAAEKGLTEHVWQLRKGALIAQDPSDFGERLAAGEHALDEAEARALRDEAAHRWRLPARLYLTIATCSLGAAVQGWDQTGSNGANLWFPRYYGIDHNRLVSSVLPKLPTYLSM